MPALNKGDFFDGTQPKTAATGKYAGQTREQIVLEKIKDNLNPYSKTPFRGAARLRVVS